MSKNRREAAREGAIKKITSDPARLKDAPRPGGDHDENKGVPGKGSRGRRASNPMQVFRGTIKLVFSFYPLQFSIIILCIVAGAALSTLPSVFLIRKPPLKRQEPTMLVSTSISIRSKVVGLMLM